MHLELTSPCCLLLGLANVDGQICQLGITLQYPPIQLAAHSSDTLLITGGRADLAYQQAEQFFQHNGLPRQGEVEIELAIPSYMGLGSAGMLGLSVAATFAALNGLPGDDIPALARSAGLLSADETLEAHAFAQGGLLLISSEDEVLHRSAMAIGDDESDWVWVLVLPRVPNDTRAALEADRRAALHAAAPTIADEAGRLATDGLLPAAERNEITVFAQALDRIQMLNYAALDQRGKLAKLSDQDRQLLAIMREQGALVCGRMLTGLGLYALIRGAGPSRAMRRALTAELGVFGGTVMASICDNAGAQLRVNTE